MPAETPAEHFARIAKLTAERKAAAEAEGTPPKPERVFRHARSAEELRHSARGNGGPALDDLEPAMLTPRARAMCRSGHALYGRRWKGEMSEELGELPRQLRRWAAGESQPDEAAIRWTRRAIRNRIVELQILYDELSDPEPPAPVDEPHPVPAAPPAPAAPVRVVDPRQVDLVEWLDSNRPQG